ncbi:hypothetical protein FRC11_004981 [Ceratobasidium sp. 423]|nr:hypothetical protein FRC11_004981 [Ceratobasidium sp. 423]
MPRPSKKRQNQLIKVRKAQEGAMKAFARRKAEKARQEAEQSQPSAEGLSDASRSAGVRNSPRGLESGSTPALHGEPPAVQETGKGGVQEAEVPLGRLRTRRQRALAR